MTEVYKEEIGKTHIPLVKHFEFVLGTQPNHSQGIENILMTECTWFRVRSAQIE